MLPTFCWEFWASPSSPTLHLTNFAWPAPPRCPLPSRKTCSSGSISGDITGAYSESLEIFHSPFLASSTVLEKRAHEREWGPGTTCAWKGNLHRHGRDSWITSHFYLPKNSSFVCGLPLSSMTRPPIPCTIHRTGQKSTGSAQSHRVASGTRRAPKAAVRRQIPAPRTAQKPHTVAKPQNVEVKKRFWV